MAKVDRQKTLEEAAKPVGTTYMAHRAGGKYEVHRVEKCADGSLKAARVFEHTNRIIARERLRVLLAGKEVLP